MILGVSSLWSAQINIVMYMTSAAWPGVAFRCRKLAWKKYTRSRSFMSKKLVNTCIMPKYKLWHSYNTHLCCKHGSVTPVCLWDCYIWYIRNTLMYLSAKRHKPPKSGPSSFGSYLIVRWTGDILGSLLAIALVRPRAVHMLLLLRMYNEQ